MGVKERFFRHLAPHLAPPTLGAKRQTSREHTCKRAFLQASGPASGPTRSWGEETNLEGTQRQAESFCENVAYRCLRRGSVISWNPSGLLWSVTSLLKLPRPALGPPFPFLSCHLFTKASPARFGPPAPPLDSSMLRRALLSDARRGGVRPPPYIIPMYI